MATISNTPRPGYVWDSTDNVWYPIGTGPHTHADYITSGSAINPTIVDAKGDIIAATAADTVARLAVGSNDQVLTADSSTATGLKWATPSSGALTYITSASPSAVSTISINNCFTSTYRNYLITYNLDYNTGGGYNLRLRYRASSTDNTSSNYSQNLIYLGSNTTTIGNDAGTTTSHRVAEIRDGGESAGFFYVNSPQATARTTYTSNGASSFSTNSVASFAAGSLTVTTAYDGFTLFVEAGTFTGTIRVYGVANS